jgi:IS30 family transposase
MLAEYQAGASTTNLAKRYGAHPGTIRKKVKRAGLKGRRPQRSSDEIAAAASLYQAAGLPVLWCRRGGWC